jgi:hypothetical protein
VANLAFLIVKNPIYLQDVCTLQQVIHSLSIDRLVSKKRCFNEHHFLEQVNLIMVKQTYTAQMTKEDLEPLEEIMKVLSRPER